MQIRRIQKNYLTKKSFTLWETIVKNRTSDGTDYNYVGIEERKQITNVPYRKKGE